jgi:hypothetical protein
MYGKLLQYSNQPHVDTEVSDNLPITNALLLAGGCEEQTMSTVDGIHAPWKQVNVVFRKSFDVSRARLVLSCEQGFGQIDVCSQRAGYTPSNS